MGRLVPTVRTRSDSHPTGPRSDPAWWAVSTGARTTSVVSRSGLRRRRGGIRARRCPGRRNRGTVALDHGSPRGPSL